MNDKMNVQTQTDGVPRQQKNMEQKTMELLPLADVAQMLHLSKITIRRMVAAGFLTAYKTCRKYLFKKEEILEYLEEQKIGGSGTAQ